MSFSGASEDGLGSIGIAPFLPCPPLPNIISEWAAILPLVCHLASQLDDYMTTGDVALMGRLSVGLLPRLGTLSGIGRLLQEGTQYLDYASTKGGTGRTVWDAKWGSVFPCANGAAIAAISKCLRGGRDERLPVRMPETLSYKLGPESTGSEKSSTEHDGTKFRPRPSKLSFRRYSNRRNSTFKSQADHGKEEHSIRRHQILHVYQLRHEKRRPSLKQRANRLGQTKPAQAVLFTFSIGLVVLLSLWGCYGTAVIVLCVSVSKLVAQGVPIRRPAGYLKNNENHDACMLVASHENATEWHLYIGERAIVDTLLNKPMFAVPDQSSVTPLAARWFWLANLLQLAAMTFVSAQKGWDGVCLLAVLAAHWTYVLCLRGSLADGWLQREGVGAKVEKFEFGGRTALLGAVQVLSKSPGADWMDKILVPHPRRAAWLRNLRGEEEEGEEAGNDALGPHDSRWLKFATESSLAAAEVLETTFDGHDRSRDVSE
ncbi:hypothetical protein N3K66_002623 [Trichothecium roseum]|uniref:Uncharacterized protein n=1 Tax=Trichothecium roseum TaxID=47278 RepID=A0ACC0VA37_9HYPO|nr:hypothetical protein N3K66_002623 [Trichothecium roseum]